MKIEQFLEHLRRDTLPDYPDGAEGMPPWTPYAAHMAEVIRRAEAHDALLKAAKEAPRLFELGKYHEIHTEGTGYPNSDYAQSSAQKLKIVTAEAEVILDNLRAAVAAAEGGK